MDVGIYLNMFEVEFDDSPVTVMATSRNKFPDLRDLRDTLKKRSLDAQVYSVESQIYGYGLQQNELEAFGFSPVQVQIKSIPKLATRLILEGFVTSLAEAEYSCQWNKRGPKVYQFHTPLLTHKEVKLYRGFELQSLYIYNPEIDDLSFVLVIDALFTYRGPQHEPLRPDEVIQRFGKETFDALLIRQGELAPQGKINLEVSRQRLLQQTLPFVEKRGTFVLPVHITARLSQEPVRVVLAGDEEIA
jgi:hypothetical protein